MLPFVTDGKADQDRGFMNRFSCLDRMEGR